MKTNTKPSATKYRNRRIIRLLSILDRASKLQKEIEVSCHYDSYFNQPTVALNMTRGEVVKLATTLRQAYSSVLVMSSFIEHTDDPVHTRANGKTRARNRSFTGIG